MFFDFECQPHTSNKAIQSIYRELLLNDDQLNRRPAYQRSPVWDEEQKSNLIDTIITRCPMPIFLLYMFEDTNECIDGQNRLTTIKEYIEQTPDSSPWSWMREYDDRIEYVYFSNPETKDSMTAFCESKSRPAKGRAKQKIFRLMTDKEIKKFNAYQCTISEIQTKLSSDQRKDIFLRWQSGTGISQCDKLKNESYPFCEYVIDNELEKSLCPRVSKLLKSGMNNWLYDIYRMINLFYEGNDSVESVLLSTIKVKNAFGNTVNFSSEKTKEAIKRLDKFLSKFQLLKGQHISTVLSLGFIWKMSNQSVRDIIEKDGFVDLFVKSVNENDDIKFNTLNNGPQEKEIVTAFPLFKNLLMAYIDEVSDSDSNREKKKTKTTIPQNRRIETWNTYCSESVGKTKCLCCGTRDISPLQFHCGHVIPESDGGSIDVENLRPICSVCNLAMGSKNMISWMKVNYPMRALPGPLPVPK